MAWAEETDRGRWRGVYRTADGAKRRRTFDHKRAALRWANAEEQKVVDGSRRDPARGRMPWGTWRAQWWEGRTAEASTLRSAASKVERHLAPRWDAVALNEITPGDVQAFVTGLSRKGLAPATVTAVFHQFSGSLKAATREGLIESNPCQGVRLPTLPSEPERYLADDEVDALLRELHGPYRILAELLLESGLRIGEAVCLHRNRVDLDRRRLTVVESWEAVEHVVKPFAKGGRVRTVPLSDRLEAVLLEWLGTRERARRCGFAHAPGSECRSELVVPGPYGAVIDPSNFTTRAFGRALERSGIGHARVHDLRHTWASRLVTAGVPIQRVQKWAGHGSLAPTQRYARLMDEGEDVFRDALRDR